MRDSTLYRETMGIDLGGNPIQEVYNLFNTVEAIQYINEYSCINPDTMEVYYIALEDVWGSIGMKPPPLGDVNLENYKLVV